MMSANSPRQTLKVGRSCLTANSQNNLQPALPFSIFLPSRMLLSHEITNTTLCGSVRSPQKAFGEFRDK